METLEYIKRKFKISDLSSKPPIIISDIGREDMAKMFNELGFTVGAEIGVAKGDYAEMLCQNNPHLKLYCIDIWERYDGYNEYTNRINHYYKIAKEKLSKYNCILIKKFSEEAAKDFLDNSLDFVYIDGAHDYRNVAIDICDWSKKVRVGGIVSGHDFKRNGNKKYINDVKDVVPSFCYAKHIRPWFVLEDKRIRTNPNWMFVRQDTDKL